MLADGVCVVSLFYPATCGPKGYGRSSGIAPQIPISCSRRGFRQSTAPYLLFPRSRRKPETHQGEKGQRKDRGEKYILRRPRFSLLSLAVPLLLWGPPRNYASDLRVSQEGQCRIRCLLLPQQPDRGRPQVFLLSCLPCVLPHFPGLRGPRSAACREVVARLPLATVAPPALVPIDLLDHVVEVRPNHCVAWQELVITAGHRFSCAAELLPSDGMSTILVSALEIGRSGSRAKKRARFKRYTLLR